MNLGRRLRDRLETVCRLILHVNGHMEVNLTRGLIRRYDITLILTDLALMAQTFQWFIETLRP